MASSINNLPALQCAKVKDGSDPSGGQRSANWVTSPPTWACCIHIAAPGAVALLVAFVLYLSCKFEMTLIRRRQRGRVLCVCSATLLALKDILY